MKNSLIQCTLLTTILFLTISAFSQQSNINYDEIKEDLNEILNDISNNYVYLNEKDVDLDCIRSYYTNQIKHIKTEEETVLFFEYLLDEFYDNHLTLHTNRKSSYRLFAPIYATISNGKPVITNVWQTQIENLHQDIIGAEIQRFNDVDINEAIHNFPTYCSNKTNPEVREWIINKILSGRYNQPRILTLKLPNKEEVELDLDAIKIKKNSALLSAKIIDSIGIIRINNTLGNDNLVTQFDNALNSMRNTKGLIIDLRNSLSGGDSYEARGIMSRFITEPKPYQKHAYTATSKNNPNVKRSWIEYVSPRSIVYKKPVVVLVGRWTGSMGEGLAIGFEGMGRAHIVGSEMRRLAGEVYDFNFKHQTYGYKLSTAKLFHINGTLREKYIPTNYVKQRTIKEDEFLNRGVQIIKKSNTQTDSILKEKLERLGAEDQTLRLMLPEVQTKFGRESTEYKYVWSLINHQDSICVTELTKILDTYGWLGKTKVGWKANQAIWLIIQHAEVGVQEKYLPLLKASYEKGESEGWHYAFLQDRILMYKKEPQIYGTQAIWDKKLQKNKIYTTRDIKNVNMRRKQIGLEPLETYAKKNGYILN
ncbi:MAG: S41 family peptidase [Flavobacteriaceae bacterium]|nr:S41 family peptidase [Flavobacteriaceae bacterium]